MFLENNTAILFPTFYYEKFQVSRKVERAAQWTHIPTTQILQLTFHSTCSTTDSVTWQPSTHPSICLVFWCLSMQAADIRTCHPSLQQTPIFHKASILLPELSLRGLQTSCSLPWPIWGRSQYAKATTQTFQQGEFGPVTPGPGMALTWQVFYQGVDKHTHRHTLICLHLPTGKLYSGLHFCSKNI